MTCASAKHKTLTPFLQNMDRAQQEVERLEADEAKTGGGPGTKIKDEATVAEVAKAVKDVSIEDKTDGATRGEIKPQAATVAV